MIGFIIWCVVMFCLICVGISLSIKLADEKKKYSQMISNPCDQTVLAYIPSFITINGIMFMRFNSEKGVNHRNNLLRQAQGYEIVSKSPNVSDSVKEQLKNAFLANGVPIKI